MKEKDIEFILFLLGAYGSKLLDSLLGIIPPGPLKEALSSGVIIICAIVMIYIL